VVWRHVKTTVGAGKGGRPSEHDRRHEYSPDARAPLTAIAGAFDVSVDDIEAPSAFDALSGTFGLRMQVVSGREEAHDVAAELRQASQPTSGRSPASRAVAS
jgi:hypothetical protein